MLNHLQQGGFGGGGTPPQSEKAAGRAKGVRGLPAHRQHPDKDSREGPGRLTAKAGGGK